jgi:hypothetical protein
MRIPTWLRWTLVVAASMVAGYVTWLFTTLGLGAAARVLGQSTADGLARGIAEALPHGGAGAAFVLVGRALAPPGRRTAPVMVVLLIGILAGLVALGVLAWPREWQLVGAGAVLVGALLAAILSRVRAT